MRKIKVLRISYRPGYGDMTGEFHERSLETDRNGKWTFVCADRAFYDKPIVKTTFAVSGSAAEQLEDFLSKKNILSLEDRPKSDLFATDYSPWSWHIDYEVSSFGRVKRVFCSIEEYKKYSGRDLAALNELREKFEAVRGEKLSETSREE